MSSRIKSVRAFIFDLDGVLTDTAEYHYRAWKRLATEEGLDFSRQENEKLRGVSRRASLELVLKGRKLPEAEMQELMDRKNGYYREMIRAVSKKDLLPGASLLLLALKSRQIKLALASASKNAPRVVEQLGIGDYFDVIAHGGSVEKTKPAPDLFLYTASELKVSPRLCLVVEDAGAGIAAAQAAGMVTVGIGPPGRVGAADFVYDSVADIELDKILPDE